MIDRFSMKISDRTTTGELLKFGDRTHTNNLLHVVGDPKGNWVSPVSAP